MISLFLFATIVFMLPAIYFGKLAWAYSDNKNIFGLSMLNIALFLIVGIYFLSIYVPYVQAMSTIGSDAWYAQFILSERGQPYRL